MNTKLHLTVLACVLLGASTVALAEEPDKTTLYEIGKDVARLEQEVRELKTALAQMLELDKQRVALLTQLVAGRGVTPSASLAASEPEAADDRRETRGSISGSVRFPEGVRVAYVYVENVRGRAVRGRTIEITQENKQFSPRWAAVQIGTTVRFPNKDTIYHNVFSRSPEAKFDLGTYRRGDEAKEHTFTQSGLIEVYCNMHSSMSTEILVVPNHLYTKVGSDGRFTLTNVPAGKRKVVVWVPGYVPAERWVSVQADVPVELAMAPGEPSKKSHLNKSGQPYGSYK